MIWTEIREIALITLLCLVLAWTLSLYMAKVFTGQPHVLSKFLSPLEKLLYKLLGVRPETQMSWKNYGVALLLFNGAGIVLLIALQMLQGWLPFNPQNLPGVPFALAFDTAVSFVTNTNWQAYSGEQSLSYLTQCLGLGTQNFLSAGTGIAVALCLGRGMVQKENRNLGNFWVDLTRSIVYVLLPLSLVFACLLVSQGVIQNFAPYVVAKTLEGVEQILPMGPAASQIAIKQLGTNGGGFFGANSAHPFENPTPFSNALECLAILLLPVSFPLAFGQIIRDRGHGRALFAAMTVLFVVAVSLGLLIEWSTVLPASSVALMEGKEQRLGIGMSAFWTMVTTLTSNGSANASISSAAPLTGGLAMVNMMLGEVVFGGLGSGMYGMILFAVVAVFIAGLMVGRSPEYLGKKIEAAEIKLAMIGILTPCLVILLGTAWTAMTAVGRASLGHGGPHGLSEILYAFSSVAANNGSSFGSLNANTPFLNVATALAMLLGRYGVIIPVLALASKLGAKKQIPPSPGTFPTDGPLFVVLLISVILIVGALTFFPALSLGPIAEHILMTSGIVF